MRRDTPTSPADLPATQVQPSPLDALLHSGVERCDDPAVKQWLRALLYGERAESCLVDAVGTEVAPHPNPTSEGDLFDES